MRKRWRFVGPAAVLAAAIAWSGHSSGQDRRKSYERLSPGAATPVIFAEGIVSTPDDESGGVFSPDGGAFYFTKLNPTTTFPRISILCVSYWREGTWTRPEVLPFSGKNLDLPARLAPDGETLYFSSTRPIPGSEAHAFAIWKVQKTAAGWGEPVPLPAPVNTGDGRWNWGPSITRDGTLYFASDREEPGRPQIYRAKKSGDGFAAPEKLGPEINSEFSESDPFVSPDESLLFFVSTGQEVAPFHHRADTLYTGGFPYARGDIYASTRVDGRWARAVHLEHGVNSVAEESAPALTPDGKHLIFSSARSPFTVPVAGRLTIAELERNLHSVRNGGGNIMTIPLKSLGFDGRQGAPE